HSGYHECPVRPRSGRPMTAYEYTAFREIQPKMVRRRPKVATASASHCPASVRAVIDNCHTGSSNIRCAAQANEQHHARRSNHLILPPEASPVLGRDLIGQLYRPFAGTCQVTSGCLRCPGDKSMRGVVGLLLRARVVYNAQTS